MIYDKESSSTPVSMIDIKHTCRDVHVGVRPGRFPSWVPFACTFVISLHNKRLFLYASSVSDALQWVKALRQTSDGFKVGQRETRDSDHHLAILQRSGADISAKPSYSHDNDIPPPPPVPAVLPVLPDNAAMTDGLAAEDDTAAIPVCLSSTGKEAHRTASFTLPESFSRDRNSSNRKRKEALWHILKKQQVEVQLAERGVYVTPLRGDDESPELGPRQPHQVRAIGSREDDRQTPMMTSSDTVPATSEPVDSHSKRMPTTASFTGIKASPFRRSKTSKHDRASCAEGCHSNGKSEKEVGARRKAMKVKRPVSAQPQLESLPERESPIGASKTSLNEDLGDAQLHVSSRMQSMETFTSLNFSDDHEPPPFRSQSCADSIHRSRDASIPDFSSPSPFVQAECTPRPKAITRLHHGRVARKDATKPPTTSRNVTFSEFPTIYSVTDVPDEDEEDSPVARDDERRKWWEDSTCAPLQYTPTRQGAVVKRRGVGTTPRVYSKQHPTMDSEISEVSIGRCLLLAEAYHLAFVCILSYNYTQPVTTYEYNCIKQ